MAANKASADFWIDKLNLTPHPEGGFYKRTFTSPVSVAAQAGSRQVASAIFYLLKSGQKSLFHRLRSDEIWFFHTGSPLKIHQILPTGVLKQEVLGLGSPKCALPQLHIGAGIWFGGEVIEKESFALVSCAVAPGFDFEDFELASRKQLIGLFPQHKALIEQFTPPTG